MNLNDVVLRTLDIVNYEGDKEIFVNEFLGSCYKEGILSLIEDLPNEAFKELNDTVTTDNLEKDHIMPVIAKYFTKENIEERFSEKAARRVQEFLDMHEQNSNNDVKEKISLLMSELKTSLS